MATVQWLRTGECAVHTCYVVILTAGASLESHATLASRNLLACVARSKRLVSLWRKLLVSKSIDVDLAAAVCRELKPLLGLAIAP